MGQNLLDAILDIPIVLPPLVVGLSLLILFQFAPVWLREAVVYEIPAVILAQFMVACAFAVRTMRATFDQIDSPSRTGGADAGLYAGSGLRGGGVAGSPPRDADGRHVGLGPGAG